MNILVPVSKRFRVPLTNYVKYRRMKPSSHDISVRKTWMSTWICSRKFSKRRRASLLRMVPHLWHVKSRNAARRTETNEARSISRLDEMSKRHLKNKISFENVGQNDLRENIFNWTCELMLTFWLLSSLFLDKDANQPIRLRENITVAQFMDKNQ